MYHSKPMSGIGPNHSDSFSHQQRLELSNNTMGLNHGGSSSASPNLASRQRLRWTNELHQRFVDAVTELGGPDKATPKGLLRLMGVSGLTIYHIKSHLQKYRLAKYIPESSSDDAKFEKKDVGDLISGLESTSGLQITEALKLQMEVQKRLQEQLEIQRQLQQRIEAQGEYLKKIIEEQQRLSGALGETSGGLPAPISNDGCHDSDKTDPSTPGPASEPPAQDKVACRLFKGHSHEDSCSSHREPPTPDLSGHANSPLESPNLERQVKRHCCGSSNPGHGNSELVFAHPVLESSSGSDIQTYSYTVDEGRSISSGNSDMQ